MASERGERLTEVQEELEQRGAENVDVGGTVSLHSYGEQDSPGGTVEVEYTGDEDWLRHAVAEVDGVHFSRVDSQQWPGGDTLVEGEIVLPEGGSPPSNPGGHVDTSGSSGGPTVPPPAERDPHVPPGGTWGIPDENGLTDECEVEVWPVRMWQPVPDVPAVSMLRYIPDPRAEGLEWWSGYALLAPQDEVPSAGLYGHMKERLREKRITYQGHTVPISYHDDEGWVGWTADSIPVEVHGVPVYSAVDGEIADLSHQEAGDLTEDLARAVLEVRREVLD